MLTQNAKDPVWLVTLRTARSMVPSKVLSQDGRPAFSVIDAHDESTITVHAVDEHAAQAYVEQQNPGVKVSKVERLGA